MSGVDEVSDRLVEACPTVGRHARHIEAVDGAVDEHHGHLACDERVEAARAAALRRQHDAVDTLVQKCFEVPVLLLDVLVGVAEQRDVVGGECGLLCGVGDVGEERVTHIGHQEADRLCTGQPERARLHVGSVSERGDRLGDAVPGLRRGGGMTREHPGRRAEGNPCVRGDVTDGDSPTCHFVLLLPVGTFPWERFHVI